MDKSFDHNISTEADDNNGEHNKSSELFNVNDPKITTGESETCTINKTKKQLDNHRKGDDFSFNRPSQFVDTVLAGNTYDIKTITIAPFMAGSLREIVLSEEFSKCPKVIRRKIMHFSFLMHAVCRYDNFDAVYNIHCNILDDITLRKASWNKDDYFETMEGRILSELFEENMKYTASNCKVEVGAPNGDSDDNKDNYDDDSFDYGMAQNDYGEDIISQDIKIEPKKTKKIKKVKITKNNDDSLDFEMTQNDYGEDIKVEPKKIKKIKKLKIKKNKKMLLSQGDCEGPSSEVFCEECDKNITLFGDDSLKKHKYRTHKQKVTCPYCAKIIFSEKWLQTHILKAHKHEKLPSYLCSVCGFESANYDEYNEHIKNHKLEVCHICQRSFKEKKILRLHIKKTHVNQNKEVCPYCGKFYKYVKAHIYSHHTTRELKKCPVCDYTAQIQSVIDYHYSRVHEGKSEKCPECGIFVKHLKNHLRRGCASRPPQRNHHCTDCDKQFSQSYQLKRHFNNIHMKIRDQLCTFCAYKTTTPFNLKIHIARVHEGRKLKSQCKYCGKEVYSLDWHIQHHHQREVLAGIKPGGLDENTGLIHQGVIQPRELLHGLNGGEVIDEKNIEPLDQTDEKIGLVHGKNIQQHNIKVIKQHNHKISHMAGTKEGGEVMDEKTGLIPEHQLGLLIALNEREKTELLNSEEKNGIEHYSRSCEYIIPVGSISKPPHAAIPGQKWVQLHPSHLQAGQHQTEESLQQIMSLHRKAEEQSGDGSKGMELEGDY